MPESTDTDKIIEILLILFLPPLAVWYHARSCTCHVCLNIFFLVFLFVIPAYIHALWYCFMRDRPVEAPILHVAPATEAPPPYSKTPVA